MLLGKENEDISLRCYIDCNVCLSFAEQTQMDYTCCYGIFCHMDIDKVFVLEE